MTPKKQKSWIRITFNLFICLRLIISHINKKWLTMKINHIRINNTTFFNINFSSLTQNPMKSLQYHLLISANSQIGKIFKPLTKTTLYLYWSRSLQSNSNFFTLQEINILQWNKPHKLKNLLFAFLYSNWSWVVIPWILFLVHPQILPIFLF